MSYGGYNQQNNNYGAPQQSQFGQDTVQRFFDSVDRDRSGQLTAEELQNALINGNPYHRS